MVESDEDGCGQPGPGLFERPVQKPGSFRLRAEQPETATLDGLDAVIITAHLGSAPPAGFNPFRSPEVHDLVIVIVPDKT